MALPRQVFQMIFKTAAEMRILSTPVQDALDCCTHVIQPPDRQNDKAR